MKSFVGSLSLLVLAAGLSVAQTSNSSCVASAVPPDPPPSLVVAT
jgi:hypothetical protein